MILSMTGFGRATSEFEGGTLTVEIKSVNSKQLDLSSLRYPPILRECEPEVRQWLAAALGRGKVDLSVTLSPSSKQGVKDSQYVLDQRLFADLISQVVDARRWSALEMSEQAITSLAVQTVLRMPNVWREATQELTPGLRAALRSAVDAALADCVEFRSQEGAATERDLLDSLQSIELLLGEIDLMKEARVDRVKQRLDEALASLANDGVKTVDPARMGQELIFYIEKLDINEEIKRLEQHCGYFRQTLSEQEAGQGRKLGFIAQEMGREINTIGSKANDAEIQRRVVMMKDFLEKMKEQLLNVL